MATSLAKTSLRFAVGCSFALLIVAGGGAAFARSHHNGDHQIGNSDQQHSSHNGDLSGNHESNHSSSHGGDWGSNNGWHHKHHHHKKSAGFGPVHGPGSSHNPIVTHPPKVPKPITTVGPVKLPREPVVRDHRNGSSNGGDPYNRNCLKIVGGPYSGDCNGRGFGGRPRPPRYNPHCNKHDTSGCEVRDHRTQPPPQCYGDLC